MSGPAILYMSSRSWKRSVRTISFVSVPRRCFWWSWCKQWYNFYWLFQRHLDFSSTARLIMVSAFVFAIYCHIKSLEWIVVNVSCWSDTVVAFLSVTWFVLYKRFPNSHFLQLTRVFQQLHVRQRYITVCFGAIVNSEWLNHVESICFFMLIVAYTTKVCGKGSFSVPWILLSVWIIHVRNHGNDIVWIFRW